MCVWWIGVGVDVCVLGRTLKAMAIPPLFPSCVHVRCEYMNRSIGMGGSFIRHK